MAHELRFTSAPHGLQPGARGYCTVAATRGIPRPLAERLEALSVYSPLFPSSHPSAALNPVAFSHVLLELRTGRASLLSRVCDSGLDYTQRSNKFAHHIVLERGERAPAGPAALLRHPGLLDRSWDGVVAEIAAPRPIPPASPAAGRGMWQRQFGDEGWADEWVRQWLARPARPAYIVYDPAAGVDGVLLQLFDEAIALLPAERRWEVTFSTCYSRLPPDATCVWRAVVAGSEEAGSLGRVAGSLVYHLGRHRDAAPKAASSVAFVDVDASAAPALESPPPSAVAQTPARRAHQLGGGPAPTAHAARLPESTFASARQRGQDDGTVHRSPPAPAVRPQAVPPPPPSASTSKSNSTAIAIGATMLLAVLVLGLALMTRGLPKLGDDGALARAKPPSAEDATNARPDAAKPEPVKTDAAKLEAVKTDAAKPDAAKPDAVKTDAAKPDAAKPDAVKTHAAKSEEVRTGVRPDAARPSDGMPAALQPDVIQSGTGRVDTLVKAMPTAPVNGKTSTMIWRVGKAAFGKAYYLKEELLSKFRPGFQAELVFDEPLDVSQLDFRVPTAGGTGFVRSSKSDGAAVLTFSARGKGSIVDFTPSKAFARVVVHSPTCRNMVLQIELSAESDDIELLKSRLQALPLILRNEVGFALLSMKPLPPARAVFDGNQPKLADLDLPARASEDEWSPALVVDGIKKPGLRNSATSTATKVCFELDPEVCKIEGMPTNWGKLDKFDEAFDVNQLRKTIKEALQPGNQVFTLTLSQKSIDCFPPLRTIGDRLRSGVAAADDYIKRIDLEPPVKDPTAVEKTAILKRRKEFLTRIKPALGKALDIITDAERGIELVVVRRFQYAPQAPAVDVVLDRVMFPAKTDKTGAH